MQRSVHRRIALMLVIVLAIGITTMGDRAEAQGAGQTISGPTTCVNTTNDPRAGIAPGMRLYTFGVRGAGFVPGQNMVGTVTFVDGGTEDGGFGIAFSGGTYMFNVLAPISRAVQSITVGPLVELTPGTPVEFVGPDCGEAPVATDEAFDTMVLNFTVEPSGTVDAVCLIAASATFTGSEQSEFDVTVVDDQGQRTLVGRADASNNYQPGGYLAPRAGVYSIEFTSVATGTVRTATGVNCPEPTTPTPTPTTSSTSSAASSQAAPACINSSLVQGRSDLQDKRIGFEFFDADNKARVITTGSSCRFFCQDGLDMNCDDQLFDTCPASLDASLVSGARACLDALSAPMPTPVPTSAPNPTPVVASPDGEGLAAGTATKPAAPRPSFTG